MIILSKGQVLKLHASLIKATGGSDGIRDEGMLDLACSWLFSWQLTSLRNISIIT